MKEKPFAVRTIHPNLKSNHKAEGGLHNGNEKIKI